MSFGNVWDKLVDAVCRPPRDSTYTVADLLGGEDGDVTIGPATAKREDVRVVNKHNLNIELSIYWPTHIEAKEEGRPCVIYCHSNSGSRRAAEEAVYLLLAAGFAVAAPDFTGSGVSEGEWVTLGMRESEDLEAIVTHLQATGKVSNIGLWGRSMGAVTALMFASKHPNVAGLVLDSPFSRLTDLMTEVSGTLSLPIPMKMFASSVISSIRKAVQAKAEFDIEELAPVDVVNICQMPALFGHASSDDFIKIAHSMKLYEAYGGAKDIITFDGGHLSIRPKFFYYAVLAFFCKALKLDSSLDNAPVMDRRRAEQAATLTCQLLEGRYAGLPLDEVFMEINRKSILITMPTHTGEGTPPGYSPNTAAILGLTQHQSSEMVMQTMSEASESSMPFPHSALMSGSNIDRASPRSMTSVGTPHSHELPNMNLRSLRIPDRSQDPVDPPPHDVNTKRSWGTGSDNSGGGKPSHPQYYRSGSASSMAASQQSARLFKPRPKYEFEDGGIDGDSMPPTPATHRSSRGQISHVQPRPRAGKPSYQGQSSEVYRLAKSRQNGNVSMQVDDGSDDNTGPWYFHSTARTPRGTVAICEYSGSHPNKKYRIRRLGPNDELPVLNRGEDTSHHGGGPMFHQQPSVSSKADTMSWSGPAYGDQRRSTSSNIMGQVGGMPAKPAPAGRPSDLSDLSQGSMHTPAPKPPAGLPPSVKVHMQNNGKGAAADTTPTALETADFHAAMMPGCLGPIGPSIRTHSPKAKDGSKEKEVKWKQHATGTTPYGGLVCEVTGMLMRRKFRWRLLLASGGSVEIPGATTSTVPTLGTVESLHKQLLAIGKGSATVAAKDAGMGPKSAEEEMQLYAIPGKPGISVTGEVLQLYQSLDPSTLNGLVKMYMQDKA